ncbi:MAG: hypothetical protein ACI9JM_001209 [Halioglobus sp.]|jgi:hypothetical protein
MEISVLLIANDMARELPRTLQSLARNYQLDAGELDYEVLLVDLGSEQVPVSTNKTDLPLRQIACPPDVTSTAQAINLALAQAKGNLICLMSNAANILTPGAFRIAKACQAAFENPLVALRDFHIGMDEHTVSVPRGFDLLAENDFLQRINWPEDGYRLFEVGIPVRAGAKNLTWFNQMLESHCLFMQRTVFEAIGGADEHFTLVNGGFLNLDILKRASEALGVTPVHIIGEGCFRQLHGDAITNSNSAERDHRLASYRQQYCKIRGHDELIADKPCFYMGSMLTGASNITARERRKARLATKAQSA